MSKTIKSKLILLLLILAFISLCFGMVSTPSQKAKADDGFNMSTGASIRLDTPSGIKFTASIGETYDQSKNYGLLIVPYDYFDKAGIAIADTTEYVDEFKQAYADQKIPFEPIVKENAKVVKNSLTNLYEVSHSIAQISEANYRRQWFGIAFIDNGDGTYDYANSNDNVRSVVEVAGAALNDYYYNPDIDPDVKALYEEPGNLDTMKSFVETSIGQVMGNDFNISINGGLTAEVGTPKTLSTNIPASLNLGVLWSTSDEEVATVDNGVVNFLKNGTVTITAKVCGLYEKSVTISALNGTDTAVESFIISKELDTTGYYFTQYNFDYASNKTMDNVKEGATSIACTYDSTVGGTFSANASGVLFSQGNSDAYLYKVYSAYNETDDNYIDPNGEKTYGGLWVKNTTGKELKVEFAFRVWNESGTASMAAGELYTTTTMANALTIAGDDTNWYYYEVEMKNLPEKLNQEATNTINARFNITAKIEDAEDGDTFYIDSPDIYYGQKGTNVLSDNLDSLEKALVGATAGGGTLTSMFTQTTNGDIRNVYSGFSSIAVSYSGTDSKGANYAIDNGGHVFFVNDNSNQYSYTKFSAYDATNVTYKSATEKTYVGFWVKNTTGKELKLCMNIKLYSTSGSFTWGSWGPAGNYLNYLGNSTLADSTRVPLVLTIEGNDTSWHYYEYELNNLPDTIKDAGGNVVRMGLATQIAGVTNGDTFYIDSFDIYHGSKAN